MSHRLYVTRLWFSAGSGIAKLHGKAVSITETPLNMEYIDYAPEVRTAICRPTALDTVRDLKPEEIMAIDAFLRDREKEMQ